MTTPTTEYHQYIPTTTVHLTLAQAILSSCSVCLYVCRIARYFVFFLPPHNEQEEAKKKLLCCAARGGAPLQIIQNGAQFVVVVCSVLPFCRCIVVVIYVLFGRLLYIVTTEAMTTTTTTSPPSSVVVIEKFCHLCISHPIQLHKREKETLPFEFLRFHFDANVFVCVCVCVLHGSCIYILSHARVVLLTACLPASLARSHSLTHLLYLLYCAWLGLARCCCVRVCVCVHALDYVRPTYFSMSPNRLIHILYYTLTNECTHTSTTLMHRLMCTIVCQCVCIYRTRSLELAAGPPLSSQPRTLDVAPNLQQTVARCMLFTCDTQQFVMQHSLFAHNNHTHTHTRRRCTFSFVLYLPSGSIRSCTSVRFELTTPTFSDPNGTRTHTRRHKRKRTVPGHCVALRCVSVFVVGRLRCLCTSSSIVCYRRVNVFVACVCICVCVRTAKHLFHVYLPQPS